MTGHSPPISVETQFNAFQADEYLEPPLGSEYGGALFTLVHICVTRT